jgi:hypothetical protein
MSAQTAIDKYKGSDPNTWLFINGIQQGMEWYNSYLQVIGETPAYCPPQKVALTVDQIVDITERYLEEHGKSKQDPIGLMLLTALIDAFPCHK